MASFITSPYPVFFDTDGTPLENGFIYIGIANQNPVTSPISVFWDEALTQPAAQPIRTLNGYVSRNGTPSQLYTASTSFSMQVRNRKEAQVYYTQDISIDPTFNGYPITSDQISTLPATQISFLQAGVGADVRNSQDKMRDAISVKDFGAVGNGTTDDTNAVIEAANLSPRIKFPACSGSYVINLTTANASSVLAALDGMQTDVPLTINLGSGVYNFPQSLKLNPQNGGLVTLKGATPIEVAITSGTPVVTATSVSGNRYTYAIEIPVFSTTQFSIGDWVLVETTGVDLTYLSYDETVNGTRHKELDGFWEITAVGSSSITVKNKSRQSSDKFPGAGTIPAATASFTGGKVTKLPTVLSFTGVTGVSVEGVMGLIQDIAIVGNNTGTNTIGIDIDSLHTSSYQTRSVGLYRVGVANFTSSGVNVNGANSSATGTKVFSSGHGTHGFRVASAFASFTESNASGCGDTVGNGFFATNNANFLCSNSTSTGVRNTGFISNRASSMTAESCFACNNGNYQDEITSVPPWKDAEGKGFESEAGSKMMCSSSVSIFCTELGFYCLAGSQSCATYCVSSGHLHAHGFYCILGSSMSARYSVARNNAARGFYAFSSSKIDARNTISNSNPTGSYVAQACASVDANDNTSTSPTFFPKQNCGGANSITTLDSFEIGTKLILTKGSNLVIASGAITVTNSYHIVDTEASSATDDLTNINGGVDGQILVFRSLTSARDIVIKHNAAGGNILLSGLADRTLDNLADKITLIYDDVLAKWTEITFANNL